MTEASNSMKAIYEGTGVHTAKVTHHCSASMQNAGFQGLQPHQLNTLTHHLIDKMYSAYGPMAEWEVCTKRVYNGYYVLLNANSHSHIGCSEDV